MTTIYNIAINKEGKFTFYGRDYSFHRTLCTKLYSWANIWSEHAQMYEKDQKEIQNRPMETSRVLPFQCLFRLVQGSSFKPHQLELFFHSQFLSPNLHLFSIQWKPLNVITLGQYKSDNINRMITITKDKMYQPYEVYFQILGDYRIKN